MANTYLLPAAQTPKTSSAVVTTAGAITTDSPTFTSLLVTAGVNGCLVTNVTAMPRATITAASLHLYISSDSGTTKRMMRSALMGAYTQAADTLTPETNFSSISEEFALRLKEGDELYCQSEVGLAAGIVFTAQYTDF